LDVKKIAFLVAAVLSVAPAFAQQGGGHPDTALAQELMRLKQVEAISAKLGEAKGTGAENLWKAELILATWEEISKGSAAEKGEKSREYLAALEAYTKVTPTPDGAWALSHAQFLLTKLSQPIIIRMEYFANNAKDREALLPLATLADKLLGTATVSLDAAMKAAETKQPFDEKAYMRAYGAAAEAKYYAAWAMYFKAMTMDPSETAARASDRQKLLAEAVGALNEWAVDDTDNGVNFQAYLLRGKVYSEGRDYPKALADFVKAQNEKAPAWVVIQARYQTVVTNVRAKELMEEPGGR
jgi:tetratricopeptide (TPR) repeat protein